MFHINTLQRKFALLCLLLSLYFFGASGYIYAKAIVAQYLIEEAWKKSVQSNVKQTPWSWADTYPVAKLNISDDSFFVLAGITGRTLAFGPGHMSSTPLPGETGNAVVAGHRDTHFAVLAEVNLGERIQVETQSGAFEYQITDIGIVHEHDMSITSPEIGSTLTLITCYPFNAVNPNPELRYVIKAALKT